MKNLLSFVFVAFAFAANAEESRWQVLPDRSGIVWNIGDDARLPHADRLEMAGLGAAVIVDYGVDKSGALTLSREVLWPTLRTQPNNTHGTYARTFAAGAVPALTLDGKPLAERPERIFFDGVLTIRSRPDRNLRVTRHVFPSAESRCAVDLLEVANEGGESLSLGVSAPSNVEYRVGCTGRYASEARLLATNALTAVAPGETQRFTLAFSARRCDEPFRSVDGEAELKARRARIAELVSAPILETGDAVLDTEFRLAKIRAGESIFRTRGGTFHSPGGGRYYAATWCNDQVEYAGPWFAWTGDKSALEASFAAYRHYMPFMADDYQPIPSSVIAEGFDYWNGAGDRGDAAMWAYGAARFVLAAGRPDWAKELRPGLRWTLEYCRRKLTKDGVVASDTDEMEGRLPSGRANLHTSVLYYDALRHAAIVERALGDARASADCEVRAKALAASIDRHFGAELHGFRTYRYYDGCTVLRSWIGSPLTVGLLDRADGTTAALLSPYLRTQAAGLLSAEGDESGQTWDRSQLYAFRGIFAAGLADRAWDDFCDYSRTRLLGEHVPYPVEAWPEGDRRHLSAESALYCRAVVEGLFGLEPTGFGTFRTKARLPKGLKRMALRNVRTGDQAFDIVVDETGAIKICESADTVH